MKCKTEPHHRSCRRTPHFDDDRKVRVIKKRNTMKVVLVHLLIQTGEQFNLIGCSAYLPIRLKV